MGGAGDQLSSNLFYHLKRAPKLIISVQMRPLTIFLDYYFITISPGKKTTNQHASVICLLAKIGKFHILYIGAWNFHSSVLGYAESDGAIFIKIC